jgi:hypothetical protein
MATDETLIGGNCICGVEKVLIIEFNKEGLMPFEFSVKPVGIDFSPGWKGHKEIIVVQSALKNTNAEAAGIKKGMVLHSVDGETVDTMKYREAIDLINYRLQRLPVAFEFTDWHNERYAVLGPRVKNVKSPNPVTISVFSQ